MSVQSVPPCSPFSEPLVGVQTGWVPPLEFEELLEGGRMGLVVAVLGQKPSLDAGVHTFRPGLGVVVWQPAVHKGQTPCSGLLGNVA